MLTGLMLALGFLHGLGADHLMAIAALSLATPLGPARYGRAFWLAVRFAVGHASLLGFGAALVLLFGWEIPARFEQGGEFVGGCLLILLGVGGGWLALSGRLYAHSHPHLEGEPGIHGVAGVHSHWHLHLGREHTHRRSIHTALPGVLGAVFAVSGLRALLLALPLWTTSHALGTLLLLVGLFAVGIVASMSLFGIVLAHALSARRMTAHVSRLAAAATAVGSVGLGIYWITAL